MIGNLVFLVVDFQTFQREFQIEKDIPFFVVVLLVVLLLELALDFLPQENQNQVL
jgi:uncharacterized protein YqgC (DUF456 family)